MTSYGKRWWIRQKEHPIREDDCLALLAYCAENPWEACTWRRLAEECGMPKTSLENIINEARDYGSSSLLWYVAKKYGFTYRITGREGYIIEVVKGSPLPEPREPPTIKG